MNTYIGGSPLDIIMPYKTGSWGEQAKIRSKKRLDYFREYQKKRIFPRSKKEELIGLPYIGQGVPLILTVETYQKAKGLCEACDGGGQVIHHLDGDHTNNVIENLQLLCKSCHMRHHNWKGDDATPHAKYMRKWRNHKKQEEGGNV